jgi:hypothetical protein
MVCCAGVVEAWRTSHLLLLGKCVVVRDAAALVVVVAGRVRCCGSGLGRVHVEKEAEAPDDEGPSIAGGKRLAKALAGHSALRVSMAVGCVGVGECASSVHRELSDDVADTGLAVVERRFKTTGFCKCIVQ